MGVHAVGAARPNPDANRMKSADICAFEPERAAQLIVDKGYAKRYNYVLEVMKDPP